MLRHLGVPTVLTVLVTGIGFASNAISGIALIRDFAIASAVATVTIACASFTTFFASGRVQ